MTNDTEHETIDALLADGAGDETEGELVLQFPSQDFPAPPAFWLRVPADWLAVPVPDAEMAVRDPVPVDGFHPNVVVRVRRAAASDTVTDDLFRSIAVGDTTAGVEVISEEVRTDLDTPARWLLARFRGPSGQVLLARHLLVYVPSGARVANIVTAVGTFPASAAAEIGPGMDRVVGSLRLATPPELTGDDDGPTRR
jgi:hypothetical protein